MEDVIMMNDPYHGDDNQDGKEEELKTLDIFHHLQLGMKNISTNCKCKTDKTYYCVPCKATLCTQCNYSAHVKHSLLDKADFELSKHSINKIFAPLDNCLQTSRLFDIQGSLKQELIHQAEELSNQLHEEINRLKELKLKEIDKMFGNMENTVKNTKERTEKTKAQLLDFAIQSQKFFNPSNNLNGGNEECGQLSTTFLLNYDLINLATKKCKDIISIDKAMKDDYASFQNREKDLSQKILEDLRNYFFNSGDIKGIVTTGDTISQNDQYNTIQSKQNNKSDGRTKFTREQIHQMLNPNTGRNEEENEEEELLKISADAKRPQQNFMNLGVKLSHDHFKPINDRLKRFNNQIDKFKKEIMNSINKTGNYKEIEKNMAAFANRKEIGPDDLFSKRTNEAKIKTFNMKLKTPSQYKSLDQVTLDNPLLEQYFTYYMTSLYGKYFKMEVKELQASHADLMIKVNDDDEVDFGKVMEGTNEIMIYEKSTRKMYRKKVKLGKNPYGYNHFPIGCRTLLIGDKLYITGGKDEVREYNNVLIYDRKTDTLRRIMDLREPRCYHTMIFNEVFETIMIIGGENKTSVEIFDPLTNRWQILPSMIYPRANCFFYFDKPRGIFYSMFGIEGNLIDNTYNETIEYLDLTDIKQGWLRMNYNNKAAIDLKNYLNVYPLNNEIMLVYGGITARNSTRTICVLNIPKAEINKVDYRMLETLRKESKNHPRLSAIVSTISLANN